VKPIDISQDPKLKKYCRKLSPTSKKAIIKRFKHYYKATGLTPTQAIIEADQEEEDQIRLRRRKIIQHLDELDEYLEGYSENTIKNTIGTIRSFYIRNYIQLPPRENTNHNIPSMESTTVEDLPGLNEIRKALSHSKPRTRAIILLMATSGMAQWEIRHLTFQDLINAIAKYTETTVKELCTLYVTRPEWTQKIGPLTWTITRQKTGRKYTTFSTPESFHEILIYLDSHPPLTNSVDEYLFRTRQGNHQIGERTFSQTFRRLNSRCGFPVMENNQAYFKSHHLRKWFANQIKKGVGYDNAQFLLGHVIRDRTRRAYLKADVNELYSLYYENMALLGVLWEYDVHNYTDDRVQEQDKRIKEQDQIIQTVLEENKKMAEDMAYLKKHAQQWESVKKDK